jgi:hypothetical protein
MPAPTYTPTDWVDLQTWVNEANMDHIEQGVKAQSDYLATADSRLVALEGRPAIPTVVNGQWLKGSGGAAVWAAITEADVANLTTDLAAKTDKATLSAKGDLYVASAPSTPTRLAVGANNTMLVADSAQAAGAKWAQIVDGNVAAAQNLTKLAAVAGAPDGTKYLRDDGTWATPPGGGGGGATRYVKTTQKDVVNTVSKVDLLNSEISIAANVMTGSGALKFRCGGDYLNNSGANQRITLELALGGTVLWETGQSDALTISTNRHGWALDMVLQSTAGTTYSTAQVGSGFFTMSNPGGGAAGLGPLVDPQANANRMLVAALLTATGAVAMNATRALTLSVTHTAANALTSMRLTYAMVEVV